MPATAGCPLSSTARRRQSWLGWMATWPGCPTATRRWWERPAGWSWPLGLSRLLLLQAPKVVLIDEADRFVTAVPRFAGE